MDMTYEEIKSSSVTEKECRAVEMLQELQRRHQELEVTLAEERGRRMACQEMVERAAILQREPVPFDSASGPGRLYGNGRRCGTSHPVEPAGAGGRR